MNFVYILTGLLLLILGGNWLLKAAVSLSLKLNISKVVIGMTVVSFATSAPELIVSINAALDGKADLALGNVVGSNIANLGLVLAITLMLSKIDIQKSFYKLDWPIMLLASLFLSLFLLNDYIISRFEGGILFLILILFLIYILRLPKTTHFVEEIENDILGKNYLIVYLLGGVFGLWIGSELLILGATSIAITFGVSERVIAVTMISVGTSIPELAASIVAIIKKQKAISLGNLIGSNIFNILAVIGITSIISPLSVVDEKLVHNDIFWMLGISFMLLPLAFMFKKMSLDYKSGIVLIGCYILFIYRTFL